MIVLKWNKTKINTFLRLWYIYCLFPIALCLLLFSSYYFVTQPQLFMVQTIDCYGNYNDCEPISTSITLFGASVTDEFVIPIVSKEEFELVKAKYDRIDQYMLLVYALIILGFFIKYKHKIEEWRKNEVQ